LFFATAGDVQEVDVHTEPEFRIGIPRRLFAHPGGPSGGSPVPFDVSGDGERFLMVKPDRSLSVPRAMVVVLNFTPVGAQR
jgi:hypothetical protein